MRIIDCQQGTPEWHAARCGRVTGSRVADIVRQTKSGPSKMRQTYAGEIVAERLSGVQEERTFTTPAIERGKEKEDLARRTYEFMHDAAIRQVGFVLHPTIDGAGASPDSLVGDEGLLEIKCPNTSTHIETLLGAKIDPDYFKQMQWGMACTGAKWCDFVSFDDRLPADMQIHIQRVHRDPILIAELEKEVRAFIGEVEATVSKLLAKFGEKDAA